MASSTSEVTPTSPPADAGIVLSMTARSLAQDDRTGSRDLSPKHTEDKTLDGDDIKQIKVRPTDQVVIIYVPLPKDGQREQVNC